MGSISPTPNQTAPSSRLAGLRPGIASISLGYATAHSIVEKLEAAAMAGFQGIDVFPADLRTVGHVALDARATARHVRRLCDGLGLTIVSLQPFRNAEGLVGTARRERMVAELNQYFALCRILGTTLIGLPSLFLADPAAATGERAILAQDLGIMAHKGALQDPPIRFAYEAVAWGPYVSRWQDAWALVQAVDQRNFGLCIDTFQLLAKVWADVARPGGKRAGADEALREDLRELVRVVPPQKLFMLQAADAAPPHVALATDPTSIPPGQHPLMTWSRRARLFPLEPERGGYLPVMDVLRACIVDLGYRGWLSMELFNEELEGRDDRIPGNYAIRGIAAYDRVVEELEKAEGRTVQQANENGEASVVTGL